MSALTDDSANNARRAAWFTAVLAIVTLVADGWTQRPTVLRHQLLLLPATACFLWCLCELLRNKVRAFPIKWTPRNALFLVFLFEIGYGVLYLYQSQHFAPFGYALHPIGAVLVLGTIFTLLGFALRVRVKPVLVLAGAMVGSAGALLLAIISFPLNYLRSDMLPVISWADRSLLLHLDPYTQLHVANRLYDFPYLPGMMLAFYPAAAIGVDLRYASMAYILAFAVIVFWAARPERRLQAAALVALFLLCPFLQYRHELYLQPHWFTLVLAFALMQRRRFAWAAVVFGVSMGIYQFSWILFPFFLLNALRRRGWGEVAKLGGLGALGSLVVVGPFLRSASHQIAGNTVGQWGHKATRALAAPINLSYWATYVIHPDQLLRLQAALMVGIFLYCLLRGRCKDLEDTLRWMIVALTTFVLFNVLVDGYFFLMLLVPMLVFTCVANGWWADPNSPIGSTAASPA